MRLFLGILAVLFAAIMLALCATFGALIPKAIQESAPIYTAQYFTQDVACLTIEQPMDSDTMVVTNKTPVVNENSHCLNSGHAWNVVPIYSKQHNGTFLVVLKVKKGDALPVSLMVYGESGVLQASEDFQNQILSQIPDKVTCENNHKSCLIVSNDIYDIVFMNDMLVQPGDNGWLIFSFKLSRDIIDNDERNKIVEDLKACANIDAPHRLLASNPDILIVMLPKNERVTQEAIDCIPEIESLQGSMGR